MVAPSAGTPGAFPRVWRALVREPSPSMADGLTTQSLGRPDLALALAQHRAYVQALEQEGLRVRRLPALPELPDSHFVEDTVVVHRGVALLTRPGAERRREEVAQIRSAFEGVLEVRELGGGPEATVDGGDVLLDGACALIGISERTNREGATQLAERLRAIDPGLPVHLVPFSGPLHLKSGLTALRPGVYVTDPHLRLEAELPGLAHELPASEGFAANVLPVNDTLFVLERSPAVRELAARYAPRVVPLDLSEFRKMDGSLTCLSVLW